MHLDLGPKSPGVTGRSYYVPHRVKVIPDPILWTSSLESSQTVMLYTGGMSHGILHLKSSPERQDSNILRTLRTQYHAHLNQLIYVDQQQ